jgi:hypothetical protein
MGTTIFVAIVVCLLLLLFGFVMAMRKKSEDEPVSFVCTECGEKDCICHLEEKDT